MATSLRRAAVLIAVAATIPLTSYASGHREAPNIARVPTVDSTDYWQMENETAAQVSGIIFVQDAGDTTPSIRCCSESA